ncbi:MAG: hypothetical protein ACLTTH_12480 [Holdemanella porci]
MNMYIGIIKIYCLTFAIVVSNVERFEPKFLDRDSYISIFYHGFDATNPDIKKFFTAVKKKCRTSQSLRMNCSTICFVVL